MDNGYHAMGMAAPAGMRRRAPLPRRRAGRTHLTLNRPDRRNALTPALARALGAGDRRLEEAGDARVIVLARRRRPLLRRPRSPLAPRARRTPDRRRAPARAESTSSRPSSPSCAARFRSSRSLQGTAAGFGLDLALACDIRDRRRPRSFTSAFARMGLVPDGGSTFTLLRLTGLGHALRLLMTGETLDAERPARSALVEEVVDDAAWTRRRRPARRPARPRPRHLRAIKRLTRAAEVGRGRAGARRRGGGAAPGAPEPRVPAATRGVPPRGRGPDAEHDARRLRPSSGPDSSPARSRSSPAAAPASASASPRASPRPARMSRSRAGSPSTWSRPPSGCGPHGTKVTTVQTNVREPEAVRADGRAGRRRPRPSRHPGEQRRRQLLRAVGHALAERLAGGRGDRPVRHVLLLARRLSGHEGTGRRADRLDLDDAALPRLAAHGARDRGQGRSRRAHPYPRARVGARRITVNAVAPGPIPDRRREEGVHPARRRQPPSVPAMDE